VKNAGTRTKLGTNKHPLKMRLPKFKKVNTYLPRSRLARKKDQLKFEVQHQYFVITIVMVF
jgi:hypothetical protein